MAIRETVERELKLRAGDVFRLPELGDEAIEPRLFVSTYHDTADHRLARRRITLRHRLENGRRLWQLKRPHGRSRLELEAPGAPDIALAAGRLVEREHARARLGREEWRSAWKRLAKTA